VLELRNEAIACMALADARVIREWDAVPPGHAQMVQFDEKMRFYARVDLQGNISIRDVASDEELARLPGSGSAAVVMLFDPDGERLAAKYARTLPGQSSNLIVWDW